ncbi:DNA adenine methylase [Shewanella sp. Iso12]|nr:DNA adenine methylase [Shewanella sp. Iso12]
MHTPILRYHGGKFRLAKWLLSNMPSHRCYVEPFGGAASVLLQKPRSHGEVYNDLDQDIFNLFKVLRDPNLVEKLIELCELTPYSRDEFLLAYELSEDPLERARRTIVRSAMGFGSGAATFHPTGFRCEAKRQYNNSAKVWSKYPPVLAYVCERLQGVNIENRDAATCIKNHDGSDTLFYVDPPYLMETRQVRNNKGVYQHELTNDEHEALLKQLCSVEGMVVLSGYDSTVYNDLLHGWERREKQSRCSAGSGTGVRKECIWINQACVDSLNECGGVAA